MWGDLATGTISRRDFFFHNCFDRQMPKNKKKIRSISSCSGWNINFLPYVDLHNLLIGIGRQRILLIYKYQIMINQLVALALLTFYMTNVQAQAYFFASENIELLKQDFRIQRRQFCSWKRFLSCKNRYYFRWESSSLSKLLRNFKFVLGWNSSRIYVQDYIDYSKKFWKSEKFL